MSEMIDLLNNLRKKLNQVVDCLLTKYDQAFIDAINEIGQKDD